ncbi:MAG: hypothetical protein NT028_11020, partial [candidate division Zixibacteria bacterium]|nr:hypothetical protein [candidate division Zixibacteria bacterium]
MLTAFDCRRLGSLIIATVLILSTATIYAKDRILLIDGFHQGELFCRAFKVTKPTSIDIHAVGALSAFSRDQMAAYSWIIRSGSLQPIWEMTIDNTERYKRDKHLREYQSTQELEPGDYEVYFYAGSPSLMSGFSIDLSGLGKALEKLKINLSDLSDQKDELEKQKAKLKGRKGKIDPVDPIDPIDPPGRIVINGEEYNLGDGSDVRDDIINEYSLEITGETKDISRIECAYSSDRVIAEILQPDNNLYASKGFSLAQPMQVEVTAIGENAGMADDFADYGWIVNAETRKRVWSMAEAVSDPAGGAEKNELVIDRLNLPKGDYVVYYVTDDSHTYDDWNAVPPYNPQAYGIRVTVLRKDDLKYVKPYQDTYSQAALIAIVRAGNDFFETIPFHVAKDCDVRVYAIGEYGEGSDAFADYGWIERVGENDLYWEMTERNTQHAGGASKNRAFDDMVHLTAGDYVLGFVTDDSHAYGDWNSGPPYDQKNYGISIYATSKAFDPTVIKQLPKETASANVLAKITYVGDDADESQVFVLDKPMRVHVVCLGEGVGSDMADYGWIENAADDDIVWEMTYRR